MTTKKRGPFSKLVLQGDYGSPYSDAYASPKEERELNQLLDRWELDVAEKLESGIDEWPELRVLMAFIWPCTGDFSGERTRYLKSEKLLEVSFCVPVEELVGLPISDRASRLTRLAMDRFIAAFRHHGKDPRTLESLPVEPRILG